MTGSNNSVQDLLRVILIRLTIEKSLMRDAGGDLHSFKLVCAGAPGGGA